MKKKVGKKSPSSGASSSPNLNRLEEMVKFMSRHEIGELEWEKGGERIRLRSAAGVANFLSPSPRTSHSVSPEPEMPAKSLTNDKQKQVLSPFVGTFYRSASPTADPYVREGQTIKRGDVLCIIEAMKLMNEIEAEIPGKIVSILVENGQPVEFGEPLFLVEA